LESQPRDASGVVDNHGRLFPWDNLTAIPSRSSQPSIARGSSTLRPKFCTPETARSQLTADEQAYLPPELMAEEQTSRRALVLGQDNQIAEFDGEFMPIVSLEDIRHAAGFYR